MSLILKNLKIPIQDMQN